VSLVLVALIWILFRRLEL